MNKFQTIFTKLKTEWKTFALAVSTMLVGGWDVVADTARTYGYDYTTLIKEDYRKYVIPAIAVAFLALRKWTTNAAPNPPVDPGAGAQ